MDADERLTALKRAYADIILNTAKEAAARIMSSERKAVRYQHELRVAKEEALGMLLRLKQMTDSKIKEAESTSLSQQRKIEELEAQLQEAEDIVNDLRVELREVQSELERVSSTKEKQVHSLDENDRIVTISNTNTTNMKHENQGNQSCNEMVQTGKPHVACPDLPSIILRSKVPELYRNGCTQRIRACEGSRNVLDGDLSVGKIKNDDGDGVNEGDDVINPPENFEQADDLLSSWHLLKSFRRKRRALRNRKCGYASPKSSPDELLNLDKTPNTGVLRDRAPGEDPSQMAPSLSIDKAESDGPQLEISVNAPESAEMSGVLTAPIEDELVMAKVNSPKQETRSLESLEEVSVDRTDLENIGLQVVNSESKTSGANDEAPRPPKDRVIKYAVYQRKRKRESLSVSKQDDTSSSKEINGEKLNGVLDPNESGSVTESSRDSRRLAQVARQLISLSEKKWWQ